MLKKNILYLLALNILFMCIQAKVIAQCPPNIGFEDGTFNNWECFIGKIDQNGIINVFLSPPVPDRQVMLKNTYPQQKDPYGGFPINCPNGSNYSIRLGNSGTGAEAERVSYTFTIPAGQNNYSIIYNYAVVLENPSHAPYQQPKFTANVFDVTANQYVTCGSFEFVASGSLPGFQISSVLSDVFFKPWSPVTIKLVGYAGKTIRLEFTTNDCTVGGHFGYAYLDVNENCSSPISGNVYCNGATSVILTAPFGFNEYHWYDANFTTLLGTGNVLRLSPPPPPGTTYAIEVKPYPGLGCLDTLYTTIATSPDAFNFVIKDSLNACGSGNGVDLTDTGVTTGSTPGLKYSYYTDASEINYVPTPSYVKASGIYYIKAENSAGCNDLKPISVSISDPPNLKITNPPTACAPNTIDLTAGTITVNTFPPNVKYSYWQDLSATLPLAKPNTINTVGRYYIKATDSLGCYSIMPVDVVVGNVPTFTVTNQVACGSTDITASGVAMAAQDVLTYTYWQDATAITALPSPTKVEATGTYYIKGTTTLGCSAVNPIQVTVNPIPVFTITDPAPVTFPATVDLTSLVNATSGVTYTYWKDSATSISVTDPTTVDSSSTYYVKATNTFGCIYVQQVKAVIKEPTITPPNVFSPNGDGINDYWEIPLLNRRYPQCVVEVYDRDGRIVFRTTGYNSPWNGARNGNPLPPATYYYIINLNNGMPRLSGNVSILK